MGLKAGLATGMRAWPAHLIFATLLVGSLAVNERTSDMLVGDGLEPAVLRVARSQRLVFREYTNIDADVRALEFDAPGCAEPVFVVLVSVAFQEEPLMRYGVRPGYVRRYVYIDRTWDKPNRLAVFVERMKFALLATFGLTGYVPSPYALVIESPSDCGIADAVDWRQVWDRDYLATDRTNNEALD